LALTLSLLPLFLFVNLEIIISEIQSNHTTPNQPRATVVGSCISVFHEWCCAIWLVSPVSSHTMFVNHSLCSQPPLWRYEETSTPDQSRSWLLTCWNRRISLRRTEA
jgi:hypothetical protein